MHPVGLDTEARNTPKVLVIINSTKLYVEILLFFIQTYCEFLVHFFYAFAKMSLYNAVSTSHKSNTMRN